jgi:prophage tail gpP-like protein
MNDAPALLIEGQKYLGWKELRVTRGITQCAADFELAVSSRWPGQEEEWRILPFAACQVLFGEDVVLTGFVDGIETTMTSTTHLIRVNGRSRTADLVDCCALIEGGEFRDSSFAAICAAVTAPFGIAVKDPASAGQRPIPSEAADQTETCFAFLERLSRMAGLLLTDDAEGALLLGRLSEARASGVLKLGLNVKAATVSLDVTKRYDRYLVRGQNPGAASWISEFDAGGNQVARPGTRPQPGITGVVRDEQVPRYRPFVMQAEGEGTAEDARGRALWQARRDAGESVTVKLTVPGWRQEDGRLWQVNERVPVILPELGLVEEDLLVSAVSYQITASEGTHTILTLAPPEAFTPAPFSPRGGRGWRRWRLVYPDAPRERPMMDAARAARRAVTLGTITASRLREGKVIVDVQLLTGESRRGVELPLPAGLTYLPAPGSDVTVLEVGGSRNHLICMVADDPTLRIEGLAPGEFGFRGPGGQQVVMRADGIELTSALRVIVDSPDIRLGGAGATKRVKLEDDTPASKVKAQ